MNNTNQLLCIGHRGAAGHAPENTLLSIQKAIDLGADWIEIDLHAVHKRNLIIHDKTLNRTTSGKGNIYNVPLSIIRKMDAGQGEQIPYLSEVFDLVNHQVGINIEIKSDHAGIQVGQFVYKMIQEGWAKDRIIVSSFKHAQLRTIHHNFPLISIGVLYKFPVKGYTRFAKSINAVSVHLPWQSVRKTHIREAHDAALKVFVFTANRRPTIKRLINLNVDGIFSDYPERILDLRQTFIRND